MIETRHKQKHSHIISIINYYSRFQSRNRNVTSTQAICGVSFALFSRVSPWSGHLALCSPVLYCTYSTLYKAQQHLLHGIQYCRNQFQRKIARWSCSMHFLEYCETASNMIHYSTFANCTEMYRLSRSQVIPTTTHIAQLQYSNVPNYSTVKCTNTALCNIPK